MKWFAAAALLAFDAAQVFGIQIGATKCSAAAMNWCRLVRQAIH